MLLLDQWSGIDGGTSSQGKVWYFPITFTVFRVPLGVITVEWSPNNLDIGIKNEPTNTTSTTFYTQMDGWGLFAIAVGY